MQIVTVPEVRVLQASRQVRLPEAGAYLNDTIPLLEADARERRLAFAGPWTFVSHNLPQDTETPFRLAICRPIAEDGHGNGQFRIVTLPECRCATIEYEGPLSGIYARGYMPLLDAIFAEGLPLTGEIREVHHVRDTPESPINQVEIQIGIQIEIQLGIRNREEAGESGHLLS
jgi:effector-binding domain-containing protein